VGVPIYVKEVLKLDVAHYAWVQAALAGGVFVGAPLIAVFGRKLPLGRILLIGVVCDGLTYLPLFFVRTFPATVVTIFFHSFFIPMITVSRATLIQRYAPVELQGRVFSIIQLCVVGGTALSAGFDRTAGGESADALDLSRHGAAGCRDRHPGLSVDGHTPRPLTRRSPAAAGATSAGADRTRGRR